MRQLESYVVMVGMYACCTPYLPGGKYPAAALAVLLLAHFIIEKPRWQLTIAYIINAYTSYSVLTGDDNTLLWALVVEVLLLISAAAACLMPVAKMPVATGPFKQIGVEVRHVNDPETRGELTGGMMVKIFYPAQIGSKGPRLPYTSSHISSALAAYINMPQFMLGHIPLAFTNAMQRVPLAASEGQKFPVVIFSHGLGGHADVYTVVAEELASQGYIVLMPTHNDLSAAYNEFPDGRVLPYRPPASLAAEAFETNKVFRNGQIKNRVAELTWLVDMLYSPKQELLWGSQFANRFDTSRIALGGHSFGGATVLCHAAVDQRIRCVFTDDAWLVPAHPAVVAGGVPHVPVMLLISNQWVQWTEHMQTLNDFFAKCTTAGSVFLGIKDTRHSNFDDVSMFSALISQKLTATGKIPLRRGYTIMNAYHVAFLAKHLLGNTSGDEILDPARSSKSFPEMIWVSPKQA